MDLLLPGTLSYSTLWQLYFLTQCAAVMTQSACTRVAPHQWPATTFFYDLVTQSFLWRMFLPFAYTDALSQMAAHICNSKTTLIFESFLFQPLIIRWILFEHFEPLRWIHFEVDPFWGGSILSRIHFETDPFSGGSIFRRIHSEADMDPEPTLHFDDIEILPWIPS